MSVLKKEQIARPVRKKLTVACAALGGEGSEVVVRQLTLQDYLAAQRYAATHDLLYPVARILADCVIDADERPIFTEAEWEAWATAHLEAALELLHQVQQLSGLAVPPARGAAAEDPAKNP